jgi:hypothetical protein
MRELGVKVVVSELDIDVIPRARWWADGGKYREELAKVDPYRDGCPPEVLQRQAEQYGQLFRLFRKHADVIARVSFWDLHDGQSWLNGFPWRRVNHPLLFDRSGGPKPAFDAVIAALRNSSNQALPSILSATPTQSDLVIESKGGPVNYKAVIDRNRCGNIKELHLPANGGPVVSDLNGIFFFGVQDHEYTLRGWSGRAQCIQSSSADVLSQKPGEVVVRVKADATGTFKVISTDQAVKARLAGILRGYQEKTVEIQRICAFKPDRIELTDEILWVHPNTPFNCIEWTVSFLPCCIQSPARLVKGVVKASFYPVGSGGDKLPKGISYPFTAENLLKNGWKVSLLTTGASFDLGKSDLFLYEGPWQQDWHQSSGFKYNLAGAPQGKPVTVKTELVFAKATLAEMPPVVTIYSPEPEARFRDEKGEVAKYKLGDAVKLRASAVNADGSPVADRDISWEVRIDAWWKRPPVILHGAQGSCTLPEAANDEERAAARERELLAILKVTVKGNNGTEATEHFAMLVARD